MKLSVNGKEQEVKESTNLLTLVQELQLPQQGIAVAVNNRMVPRPQWESLLLYENDQVIIIKAACGG